ncbi:hypothetical protein PHLCEN_2v11162 [Hermanssonia centrifuga]|uniref:Uncharacterized protein n=1 Tax=Hermanssonia centrifuga TaxID=98765 RepID=A0A2R6NKT2_9APHY|nr:hypothetical protein PHLCEN_2v11162 [Hermanssonia centrifuga]
MSGPEAIDYLSLTSALDEWCSFEEWWGNVPTLGKPAMVGNALREQAKGVRCQDADISSRSAVTRCLKVM